jgi:hypothetical protein
MTYVTIHDAAKILVKEHLNDTYIRVVVENSDTRIASLTFYQKGEVITDVYKTGIYILWRKTGNMLECMYVGQTGKDVINPIFPCLVPNNTIRNRVYRWFKELLGKSRPTESHPGAKKAREEYGATVNDIWYLKIIPSETIEKVLKDNKVILTKTDQLDEHVAHILKSMCNVRKSGEPSPGLDYYFLRDVA